MNEVPEVSRTFLLDRDVAFRLRSTEEHVRRDAILELPEALTSKELQDVVDQMRLGPDSLSRIDSVFEIGSTYLCLKSDFVTAENAAKELRGKGINCVVGSLVLRSSIKKFKKQIINTITDPTPGEL